MWKWLKRFFMSEEKKLVEDVKDTMAVLNKVEESMYGSADERRAMFAQRVAEKRSDFESRVRFRDEMTKAEMMEKTNKE